VTDLTELSKLAKQFEDAHEARDILGRRDPREMGSHRFHKTRKFDHVPSNSGRNSSKAGKLDRDGPPRQTKPTCFTCGKVGHLLGTAFANLKQEL